MKKKYLILLISIILIPFKVNASGGFSLSTSSINMYVGESKTITIYSDNSVGKLNIFSSNGSVAASLSSIFIQTPGSSQSFTVNANSVGTSTISVVASDNYATMDEEILSGVTKTVTVNVIEQKVPSSNENTNNTNTNNNVKNNQNYNYVKKSSNNKIKDIIVDGYSLEKIDDNNYKLIVSNNVTIINVSAEAEDSKSTITGTGLQEINVGENNIAITITAENGNQNIINIQVTRKDGYYLEDLETAINNETSDKINIIINKDDKLSNEEINMIKNSNKVFNFNYYDDNKILNYSWIINGSKLSNINELSFNISNNSEYSSNIEKLTNYASILHLTTLNNGIDLKGCKVKYNVGQMYNDNDIVNLYVYDNNKNNIKMVKSNLGVNGTYIEFELDENNNYFISKAKVVNEEKSSVNYFMIISIIEFIIILSGGILFFKYYKKRK